jgi:HAD superfamily hydrolase (TIGR01549 family)
VTLRALTLDLDDTLWPVWPAITRAEENLHRWLSEHAPRTAARYPLGEMRLLRDRVALENPHLAHDFSAQRRLSLAAALRDCEDDPAHADTAFEVFYAGRNQVDLYPDVPDALARLSKRFPIAALTNGNADVERIGLGAHFTFVLGAREHGTAKPCPTIFHAACARLNCAPHEVLHIGDDPELDVLGGNRAGLLTAWINRTEATWAHAESAHVVVRNLGELADWIDLHHPAAAPPSPTDHHPA